MVRLGFIRTKDEIKFLVLFAMDLLPFPVDYEAVVDLTTWCDGGFGFFELSEAFYEMIPSGHIAELVENGKKQYEITEKGRESVRALEKQIPYAVREAAQRSALRVVRQIRRDAAIHTHVETHADNDLTVRMEMDQVFAIEMNVVNRSQSSMLERTFKENAEKIYQVLLGTLTADYEGEKEVKG